MNNNICIIPARGGSKRIPRKNIKPFCGKPIIYWSIRSAIDSKCFSNVFVSTEDPEISKISLDFGAEILPRDLTLSNDSATLNDVMKDACLKLSKKFTIDTLCCLLPTAPFITPSIIQQGLRDLKNYNYVFTVSELNPSPYRSFTLSNNQIEHMVYPQHLPSRTQDLQKLYYDAGQMYWGTFSSWSKSLPAYNKHSSTILLKHNEFKDIDTDTDWLLAEQIFKNILAIH